MSEAARGRDRTIVVEAEAVDQRAIAWEAEHPRLRVAGLRLGGDGSDLDEAEPEREQRTDSLGVLVEAGGETERTRELAAKRRHAQLGSASCEDPAHQRTESRNRDEQAQQRERHAVRALGGEALEHEPVQEAVHLARAS